MFELGIWKEDSGSTVEEGLVDAQGGTKGRGMEGWWTPPRLFSACQGLAAQSG